MAGELIRGAGAGAGLPAPLQGHRICGEDAIQWCGLGKVAHINALCHSIFEGNLLVQCLACKQVGVNGSQSLH